MAHLLRPGQRPIGLRRGTGSGGPDLQGLVALPPRPAVWERPIDTPGGFMLLFWLAVASAGLLLTVVSSRVSVDHAVTVAVRLHVAPFLIGVTLMAIGTDLPEIANSILASLSGYGDLNVGDSIGSAATQVTLVLGLLPLAGGAFFVGRGRVPTAGTLTILVLVLGAFLVGDGHLSRLDGGLLVAAWAAATVYLWRHLPPDEQPELPMTARSPWYHGAVALFAFVGVAGGAAATVTAVVRIAGLIGVPLFVVSFFAVSIGTSLPELVVTVVALRRGQADIAIGDILGASLMDASLSVGIGPLVAPTAVTANLALRGMFVAAVAALIVTIMFTRLRRHGRATGLVLLGVYALSYPVVLAG